MPLRASTCGYSDDQGTARCACPHVDSWLAAIENDNIPELHTFARGIRRHYAAVRNGLTLPHNSGACEGKRQQAEDH